MKKVRNIRWHTALIDTLKTVTSNFVLNPSLHWKPVFSAVLLHFHAWTYEGEVGLHDFVCAEAYSVCCQLNQQGENYSRLTKRE